MSRSSIVFANPITGEEQDTKIQDVLLQSIFAAKVVLVEREFVYHFPHSAKVVLVEREFVYHFPHSISKLLSPGSDQMPKRL
jgi:hypothetical protein